MKRSYSSESSSFTSRRIKPNPPEDANIIARKVADHYSSRTNQTFEERESSPIIHLKKLNNWIKSVLIHLHARRGDVVLDLACGKGGDLGKWDKAGIGYYVGIDIARVSIQDCRSRYNQNRKLAFPARLMIGDCYEACLDMVLADEAAAFDICSCQFALHFSWSTEERARRALDNVSALLRPGGTFIGTMPDSDVILRSFREAQGQGRRSRFGNSLYQINFDEEFSGKISIPFGIKYMFHLEDAVDCSEWLVPFEVFKRLAKQYDMELVFVMNSHEFVNEYMKRPEFVELFRRMNGIQDRSTPSNDEQEGADLYLTFALRKLGKPYRTSQAATGRRRDGGKKMHISEEDIFMF